LPQPAVLNCVKLDQVYSSPKETFECLLEVQEIREAARHLWLDFHDHIDVAAGIKVLA
jgi:hypothetical protein